MPWFPGATRRDGPADKLGYPSTGATFGGKLFLVAHSMEGPLSAGLGELDRPDRRASWTFSNPKAGPLLQHYDSDAVSWASGSLDANKLGVPIEHEGVAGEPLTQSQIDNLVTLLRWLKGVYGWVDFDRLSTLREHKEMTVYGSAPTACPSNRIPWPEIIAALEEDEMTPQERQEFDAWKQQVQTLTSQIAWLRVELGLPAQFDDAQNHVSVTLQHIQTLMSQVAWLRSEVGLPAQFDPTQDHASTTLQRIVALEGGAVPPHPHTATTVVA